MGPKEEEEEEENPEDVPPQPASQSYAATVALASTPPSSATLMGTLPPIRTLPAPPNPRCVPRAQMAFLLPFPRPGYSEEGGAQKGEVIPEHEFAEGPVCLDDENEFPPFGNQSN